MGKMSYSLPIEGIVLDDLPIIPTEGGNVLKMLSNVAGLIEPPSANGEVYFSEINPGVIRAWKCHAKQRQLMTVPVGLIKIAFFDGREDSPTWRKSGSLLLGRPGNYRLLRIPCGIWYGFGGMANHPSLICNFTDLPHDATEISRAPAAGPMALIDWNKVPEWHF